MKKLFYIIIIMIFGLAIGSNSCNKDNNESIKDYTPPVITIIGANPNYSRLDSTYIDPGATAMDNVDGDVTANIVTTSNVNIHQIGTYQVNYRVGDRAGNVADTFRIVKVLIFKSVRL
jgi:hypothetical protein